MSNLLNIKDQNGNWIPIPVITNGIQSITQNQDYTLTITLNDGTTYTTTSIKGEDGRDYILTENDKQDIAGLVDTHVDDVQIDGTSILQDGVANIPVTSGDGSSSKFGVVKTSQYYGIGINDNGQLFIHGASTSQAKTGTFAYRAITPDVQEVSTFYGLAKVAGHDEKNSTLPVGTYTEDAKTAIRTMLGLQDVYADYSSALKALGVI